MTDRINESLAGRLESTAPRALRFLVGALRLGPVDPGPRRLGSARPTTRMSAPLRGNCARPWRPDPERRKARQGVMSRQRPTASPPSWSRALVPFGGTGRWRVRELDQWARRCRARGGAPYRGRPALNVEGERIEDITDQKHPGSGFWRVFIDTHEQALVRVASATGAVAVLDRFTQQRWVQGTAWLIRPDLVVTNRHVLFPPVGLKLARRNPGQCRRDSNRTLKSPSISLSTPALHGPHSVIPWSIFRSWLRKAIPSMLALSALRRRPQWQPRHPIR